MSIEGEQSPFPRKIDLANIAARQAMDTMVEIAERGWKCDFDDIDRIIADPGGTADCGLT
jgi:hypothetical protein